MYKDIFKAKNILGHVQRENICRYKTLMRRMIPFKVVFGKLTVLFRRLRPGAVNVRQVMRSLRDFSRSSASAYTEK